MTVRLDTILREEANPEVPEGGGEAPATPIPPSPYAEVFDAEGNFTEGWSERLPTEYQEFAKTSGNPKNLGELVKSYAHARKKVGVDTVVVPTENSTPEQVAEYRQAVGVPEDPALYGLSERPQSLPEGLEWDSSLGASIATWAQENNVPPAAVAKLVEVHTTSTVDQMERMRQQAAQAETEDTNALRMEWGVNYETNLENAQAAVNALGGDLSNPVWNDPAVKRVMAAVGAKVVERQPVGMGSGVSPLGPRARAQEIMQESDYATNKAKQAEVMQLYQQSASMG